MKTDRGDWPAITYVFAFLIGVTLFWSFGKYWLDFEFKWVFLAGLLGVAVSVIFFRIWNIIRYQIQKDD